MKKLRKTKQLLTIAAIFLSVLLLFPSTASAAGKPKLNATKKTINVGDSCTVKLLNNKKKVKWTVSNKNIRIVSKNNKQAKIKGIKKGTSHLKAKVGNKTYKCKFSIKKKTSGNSGTKTNFNKNDAKKKIQKTKYKLNGSVFVLLKSDYEVPTSITANCYFFDEKGNPVGDSYSYLFWLENGREGILEFRFPEQDFATYDIKYDFFQSIAYTGNKSIINKLSITSNLVKGNYEDKLMITLSNGSDKDVSSSNVLVKYYNGGEIVYFKEVDFYDIKSGDYGIEEIYSPINTKTYEDIEYDKYEVSVSTACYNK